MRYLSRFYSNIATIVSCGAQCGELQNRCVGNFLVMFLCKFVVSFWFRNTSDHLSFLAEKYCDLLVSEGGIDLLSHILNSKTTTASMKKYADMAVKRVAEFRNGMNDVDESYVIVEN